MTAPTDMAVELGAGRDSDQEELAELTGLLRAGLLDLDVRAVRLAESGQAPDGSKSAGWLAAGQLVVTLVASPEMLMSVIGAVRSWVGRSRAHSVKLTLDGDALEVTGVTSAEQDRLIELWVSRHAAGS